MEHLQLIAASGDLFIRGTQVMLAVSGLTTIFYYKIRSMFNSPGSVVEDVVKKKNMFLGENTQKTFGALIVSLIVTAVISYFSKLSEPTDKEYSDSSSKLSKSYKNYNKIVKQQRRKRTSKVLKLGVVARRIKKNRLYTRKENVLNKIKKGNSVVSKLKTIIFGGFTQDELREQLHEINRKLEDA